MDSKCGVCFESNTSSSNSIIECESCGIEVHYKCYGINGTQNDLHWHCDVCQFKKNHHTKFAHTMNIKCTLCPNQHSTDVLKQQNNGEWAHIFCSLWNENHYHRIIKGIQTSNISEPCTICNESYGTTQRCFYPQCNVYYHPLCGKYNEYAQIICKTSLFPRAIFIQFCGAHKDCNIYDILRNEEDTESGVGPIRFESDKEEEEQQQSLNISFLSRTNSSLTDATDEILTESDDDHDALTSTQILSLDEKLQRNDIALSKKDVIELLWNRSAKYHQAVTTKDYLRIAPHDYYNDPLFSTPYKGKANPFDSTQHEVTCNRNNNHNQNGHRQQETQTVQNDDRYRSLFSCRYKDGICSQFHDIIQSEESNKNKDDDEWTLNGIKNKLLNDINNERMDCDDALPQHKEAIDVSLNYVTNPSVNKLPAPLNDNEISLIPHQLGLDVKQPPTTAFDDKSSVQNEDNIAWDGDESSYRVEMDPFGWRWVLKQTEIAPDIAQISCPCLLCTYIAKEYRKRRQVVHKKAIDDPLNIAHEADILETRRVHKETQNVLISSEYGRVLCEYAVQDIDDDDDDKNTIEFETILNETETKNGLQPRMVNTIESIANQRWSPSGGYFDRRNIVKDAASSVYHIDRNKNTANNNKRGRKRKRSSSASSATECNGFSSGNHSNKKRRKGGVDLHAFRELDADPSHDVNNEITRELYQDIVRLYSIMRVNDDRKHMIRTQLRGAVQLDEECALNKLYAEVVQHAMKHICIWQQIRRHFCSGFSDKCGIFHHHHSRWRYDDDNDVSVCCVCFDGTFTDSNPIIFCDCCNIGVHRYCYGLKKIPTENAEWLCVSCRYLKNNKNNDKKPQCCLCPIGGGALKRTKEGGFAHITCSMWCDGIEIGDIARMTPILNVDNVRIANKNNDSTHNVYQYFAELIATQCSICGENEGGFISCAHDECSASFHVLCAWFNGQYMRIYLSDDDGADDGLKYAAFCCQHTPENVGGAKHRNFNKFRQLRKQGLTENKMTAQIHRRERILNSLISRSMESDYDAAGDGDPYDDDQYLAEQCAVCFDDNRAGETCVCCRSCGVYVHLNCYGSSSSVTNWLCDVCSLSPDDIDCVECVLCPRRGGALKMADNKYWVHVACVRYIPHTKLLPQKEEQKSAKIIGVAALLSKCDENQCYLCHSCEGYTIQCQHSECNLYFHALCSLFCFNAPIATHCRKHCAILQIKGGVHHMYQNVKLLQLRKTYRRMQCLFYLLQQRQFRNKCLIEKVENEIEKMLPKSYSKNGAANHHEIPCTPASQLIVNHHHDEEEEEEDKNYERYCDLEKKSKYKMAQMLALKNNMEIDDDNNQNVEIDIAMNAINTLPNYSAAAINAVNRMYAETESASGELLKSMCSIVSDCDRDRDSASMMMHFEDAEAVNKLVSFAKFLENKTSQIFNDCNATEERIDLDVEIKTKCGLKEKIQQMDEIYLNQMFSPSQPQQQQQIKQIKEEEEEEKEKEDLQQIDPQTGNQMKCCELCGRQRGKGWSISVWLKHLNNKHVHKCDQCPFRTTKSSYLKNHISDKH